MKTLIVSTLALCTAGAFAADGIYQGSAMGKNDRIHVEVTIKNDKIADVKIGQNFETEAIARYVFENVPKYVVENQSLKMDAISGATFTSFGLMGAIRDAVAKSGLDVAQFTKKKAGHDNYAVDTAPKADVVIVGAGGAGLSAAVAAARAGASVVILEKSSFVGGNTMAAGGGFNAADSELIGRHAMAQGQIDLIEKQIRATPKNDRHAALIAELSRDFDAWRKAGKKLQNGEPAMFDSPAWHALQTWSAGDYQADLALVEKLARIAPESVKSLESMGLDWNDFSSQYVGAMWPRSHDAENYKSGWGFIDTFLKTIEKEKLPVKIQLFTKAEKLLVENGRVVGVEGSTKDGQKVVARANNGVILATGGFAANVKMRMKYDGKWGNLDEKLPTTNLSAITGDGIVMAEKVGANLVDMQYIQLLPICDPQTGSVQTTVSIGTPLYVNNLGKRFVNELERRDVISAAVLQQPQGRFWKVINEKNARIDKNGVNSYGLSVKTLIEQGKVVKADTVEELARKMGVPEDNLVETVKTWNEFCKKQVDTEFGRPSCLENVTLFEGPYYADVHSPAVHHTMGGIQIDTDTHVLDKNGKIIPGLYAAGEVTGGIHGTNRVGANAIPDAISFGRVAGETVAKAK